jgi:ribonuclease HII
MNIYPDFKIENNYPDFIVAGIDEAGRGPIAGPVVSACVILNHNNFLAPINDSKKLSKLQRLKIFHELQQKSKFGIGIIDEKIIDKINILQATKLAMLHAFLNLQEKYKIFLQVILVDGNFIPFSKQDQIQHFITVVKGDQKSLSIAAASIIAKETRDEIMNNWHQEYPQFGFNQHFGYPTKLHIERIHKFGICKLHRKSFEPVKSIVYANNSGIR